MNKKNKISLVSFVFISLISLLVSCGGGGGGDGSGSSSSSTAFGTVSSSRCAGSNSAIKVVHAGIDTSPIDIFLNDVLSSTRTYGRDNVYFNLSNGTKVSLVSRLSQTVLHQSSFNTANGNCQTLVFTGTNERDNLNANFVTDAAISLDGNSAVRIINATSENSTYTLSISGSNLSAPDGGASKYVAVPAGTNLFGISGPVGFSNTFSLEANKHYSLIIRGESSFYIDSELVVDNF